VPAAPAPVSGATGDRIAAIAQQYLGYRYVWGGTSPAGGFDCSGFTWYVYKQAGIGIPRAPLGSQLNSGPRVSRDQLLPGDLLFWQNTYVAGISHTGIYLGGGRFINAESESVGVQIRSLNDPYWSARFLGASRPR
jgi:cell wall-associated NlpC family hydrolase